MTGFLTLDDLVLSPPLPAISSLLLVAGAAGLADWGLRRLCGEPDVIRRAAAFIAVTALCGAIVHGLALAHLSSLTLLRILAAMLALCAPLAWPVIRGLKSVALVTTTVLLLALASLGPVSDPDSLDYHLGIPLDWLRHGGVVLEPHWLHARVVGLGESLNMLGLAAGTDGLGAALQVSGLVALVAVIGSVGKTARDRAFGMMLALPPAILPLAMSQKPQLLPVAAVVVAMILARSAVSNLDFALVFACVGFAMACKYSFLVSGGVVAAIAMYWAWEKGRLGVAARWAAICPAVLVLPVWGRNFYLYGDPLSPFFERFRHAPDTEVLRFADYLQDAGAAHTLAGIGRFVEGLVLPTGAGDVQTVIGIGVLCVLFVTATGWTRAAVGGGAVVALFTIWRGQMAPRYLLEPYFWCAAAAVAGPWSRMKSVVFYGLTAQTAGVAAMAAVGAFLLFPGALTQGMRDRVMSRSTFGYDEARWIDRVIPKGATIMAESRAYALLPRPFVIPECAACGPAPLLDLFRNEDVDAMVLNFPVQGTIPPDCDAVALKGPVSFAEATRNPFNRGQEQQAVVWQLKCSGVLKLKQ